MMMSWVYNKCLIDILISLCVEERLLIFLEPLVYRYRLGLGYKRDERKPLILSALREAEDNRLPRENSGVKLWLNKELALVEVLILVYLIRRPLRFSKPFIDGDYFSLCNTSYKR